MELSYDFNNAKPASDTTSDTLLVNFSWKKFSTVISDSAEPTKPLYTIAYNVLRSPDMDFRSVADNKQLAHANVHVFGINPTLILHGKEMSLRASRRLKTQYSYPSTAVSSNGAPTLLTYTSESSFKNWDYILLDPQLQPVARFSSNLWATKKIGKIEFMGNLAQNQQFREEVIVTSLTVSLFVTYRPVGYGINERLIAADVLHHDCPLRQHVQPDWRGFLREERPE
jgi:hypothetical protein